MKVDLNNKLVSPSIVPADKPQARHRAVVRGSETTHHDRINCSLGNQMRRGLREEKVPIYRTARSLQSNRLAFLLFLIEVGANSPVQNPCADLCQQSGLLAGIDGGLSRN
ncbi:hypothetical protein DPMN_103657 [Dreissena polymorpha]|uniref:Uncharacterized protein n=1 Tax=Dreissena polymorpha TaxID=45954 RepID=A0A9D4HAG5_DREPO|nr:hypothetical protein DPMN_103657 [Dreissena polymorpha]